MPNSTFKNSLAALMLTILGFCCSCNVSESEDKVRRREIKELDISSWSFSIDVIGNRVIVFSKELDEFVAGGKHRWLKGLADTSLLNSLETHAASETQEKESGELFEGFRVCDFFYLRYCAVNEDFETPSASEFENVEVRNSKIKLLVTQLKERNAGQTKVSDKQRCQRRS